MRFHNPKTTLMFAPGQKHDPATERAYGAFCNHTMRVAIAVHRSIYKKFAATRPGDASHYTLLHNERLAVRGLFTARMTAAAEREQFAYLKRHRPNVTEPAIGYEIDKMLAMGFRWQERPAYLSAA